jgi:hypothetical protein
VSTTLAELDAAVERARRFKPIPVPLDGQCVRDAVAAVLRRPPHELPLRMTSPDALAWAEEVGQLFDVKIELVFADQLPPPDGSPWVAIVEHGDAKHAIGMVGRTALSDVDRYHFRDPAASMVGGLRIKQL